MQRKFMGHIFFTSQRATYYTEDAFYLPSLVRRRIFDTFYEVTKMLLCMDVFGNKHDTCYRDLTEAVCVPNIIPMLFAIFPPLPVCAV